MYNQILKTAVKKRMTMSKENSLFNRAWDEIVS